MLNVLKKRLSLWTVLRTGRQVWERDPLMHPDIQTMDMNQIADLPMWAGRRRGGEPKQGRNGADHGKTRVAARLGTASLSTALPLALTLLAGLAGASPDAFAQSPESTAAFGMPADFDQWKPDIFGQNGAYRFRQVGGNCQVTFLQNRGVSAARAAGQEPRHSLDAYIDQVGAQVGRVERVEVDPFDLPSDPYGKVSFVSTEFAYEGKDRIEYHNRISAAWIDDVELLIIAACPASEWLAGRQSVDAFIDKVTIGRFSNP